ncbi:MAG: OmpA family protein, partial [Planctomycetota bacterium]
DALPMLSEIQQLLAGDANRRAIIFGHTDTVGTDEYNKLLSERRAKAIFAALAHSPAEWEELYNRESWGVARIQLILRTVSDPADPQPSGSGTLDQPTIAAVKRFQSKHPPLDIDGDPGPKTRRELFKAYFAKGANPPADPTRFVVFGDKPFMGCGEFNPFTEGAADEASRRVVVQVFDRASEPKDLPCRIGDLGPCKANLLKPGDKRPEGDDPKTVHFRCKIFLAIERRCHAKPPVPPIPPPGLSNGRVTPGQAGGDPLVVTLHDLGRRPFKNGEVTVAAGEFRTFGKTDERGVLSTRVPPGTSEVALTYMPPDAAFLVTCTVRTKLPPVADDKGAVGRLENLGYPAEKDRDYAIYAFQKDHGLAMTLALDGATRARLAEIHGS